MNVQCVNVSRDGKKYRAAALVLWCFALLIAMAMAKAQSGSLPSVITGVVTGISTNSATLNGFVNPNNLPTTFFFEYGTATNYGSATLPQSSGSSDFSIGVASTVNDLIPGVLYHYRLVANSDGSTLAGGDQAFITLFAPPSVFSQPVVDLTSNSAILRATINPNKSATTVSFEYGLTQNYGSITTGLVAGDGASEVTVAVFLSGLQTGATYHFRAVATNVVGKTVGADRVFTVVAPPQVVTLDAVSAGTNTATLKGLVNPAGTSTTVGFQYGLDLNYGLSTTGQVINPVIIQTPFSAMITGLLGGVTYHFRVVATTINGLVVYGKDQSFYSPPTAPFVSPLVIERKADSNFLVSSLVYPNGSPTTAFVQYGASTNFNSSSQAKAVGNGTFTEALTNLASGLLHYARVAASNEFGLTYGDISTLATPAPVIGTALRFAGTNSYLNIPGGGGLNAANQCTIELWVKWDGQQPAMAVGYGAVFSRQSDSDFSNAILALDSADPADARITWRPFDVNVVVTGTTPVGDGIWHHVALTLSGGLHRLYLDGKLDGTGTSAGSLRDRRAVPLTVGGWNVNGTTPGMHGEVDEVRIWNIARTDSEIASDAKSLLLGNEAGLVTYMRLDDGYATTATDATASGNSGALTGNIVWVPSTIPGFAGSFPSVITGRVGEVSRQYVTVAGQVNANRALAQAYFEYGLTQNYDMRTETQTLGAGGDFVPISVRLANLSQSATYNYRLVAYNDLGTNYGLNHRFISPGDSGFSLDFPKAGSYVTIPGGGGLNAAQQATVEMWVRWDGVQAKGALGYGHVMSRQLDGIFSNDILALSAGDPDQARIVWYPFDVYTSVVGQKVVGSGVWHHVAIAFAGSIQKLYVDGVLEASQTVSGNSANNASVPLVLGAWIINGAVNGSFHGQIDGFRVWNLVRSQPEILATKNLRLTGGEPGLVTCLNLYEGAGNVAADSTGNGRNGTLVAGAGWSLISAYDPSSALPLISGLTATNTSMSTALLYGLVNPNGFPTEVYFEWGTNGLLDHQTLHTNIGSGAGMTPVTAKVSGILPGGYSVRLTATNASGLFASPLSGWTVPGPDPATALIFDLTNVFVTVPDGAALSGLSEGTIEAWARWDGYQPAGPFLYGAVMTRYRDASASCAILGLSAQDPSIAKIVWKPSNADIGLFSRQPVGFSFWHHIAVTFEHGLHSLYVDGEFQMSAPAIDAALPMGTNALSIGSAFFDRHAGGLHGSVSDFRVWKVVRSPQLIRATMNHRLLGTETGLEAYLRFDDIPRPLVLDSSGHGHTAYFVGIQGWNGSGPSLLPGLNPREYSPIQNVNGRYHIKLETSPDINHALQTSDNLLDWATLGTVSVGPTGVFESDDVPPQGLARRYYRTISVP